MPAQRLAHVPRRPVVGTASPFDPLTRDSGGAPARAPRLVRAGARAALLVARAEAVATAVLVLAAAVVTGALLVGARSRAAADGQEVTYRPPVAAPIVDHFRPPEHPYGPGNRGVDYATVPGTTVTAAAPGRVTFAGSVAGRLVVVLVHADGLRSTYDDLAAIVVAEGEWVSAGAPVGLASAHLHFGVRDGTTYLDPELLFAAGAHGVDVGVVARLVPSSGGAARLPTKHVPT
jgi:murein DD-endopeptidase MepM/ murein hydrolase activator NlpD